MAFFGMCWLHVLVGFAQAASTLASHSLLSDKCRPDIRAPPLSVFTIGAALSSFGAAGTAMLRELFGWRITLIASGVAGLDWTVHP